AHKLLRRQRLMTRVGLRRTTPVDLDAVISKSCPPPVAAELAQVYRSLAQLNAETQVALVLHRVDGVPLPEVATQMGISLSTGRRRIKSAEKVLAELAGRDA